MTGLINRILKLSGKYAARIKVAFVFSFFKSILSKMPICWLFWLFADFTKAALRADIVCG